MKKFNIIVPVTVWVVHEVEAEHSLHANDLSEELDFTLTEMAGNFGGFSERYKLCGVQDNDAYLYSVDEPDFDKMEIEEVQDNED